MSNLDQLVYLRLLCHSWLRDGLPESVDVLSRLAGIQVSPDVLVKFPLCNDGKRRNARLEEIRAEQRARIASRRHGAMKTNMKRWNGRVANESLSDRSATVERVANESLSDRSATIERVANESPPPTTHPKERENTVRQAEAIANAYPRKDAPIEVLDIIAADLDAGEDPETMQKAVQCVAEMIQNAPGGSSNKFVPKALNFFQGRQWRSPEAFDQRWTPKAETNGHKRVTLTTNPNNGW
jgi:hypothetical protein